MKATKIKMKPGCYNSYNLEEIDEIFIEDYSQDGLYKKEILHDYLKGHPNSIYVNEYPYPYLEPCISKNGEKYVRSKANDTEIDNLLCLPRI